MALEIGEYFTGDSDDESCSLYTNPIEEPIMRSVDCSSPCIENSSLNRLEPATESIEAPIVIPVLQGDYIEYPSIVNPSGDDLEGLYPDTTQSMTRRAQENLKEFKIMLILTVTIATFWTALAITEIITDPNNVVARDCVLLGTIVSWIIVGSVLLSGYTSDFNGKIKHIGLKNMFST